MVLLKDKTRVSIDGTIMFLGGVIVYICKPEDLQKLSKAFENEPNGTHILAVNSIHVLTCISEYAKENDTTVEDIKKRVIDGKLNLMAINGISYIAKNLDELG